jgi:hypothetical protein
MKLPGHLATEPPNAIDIFAAQTPLLLKQEKPGACHHQPGRSEVRVGFGRSQILASLSMPLKFFRFAHGSIASVESLDQPTPEPPAGFPSAHILHGTHGPVRISVKIDAQGPALEDGTGRPGKY